MSLQDLQVYNNLYEITERKQLIADMLTALRETNHYQKKDVAQFIGIKPQTYGAYESGRNEPPAEILVRLSLLYDFPVDLLVQRDNMSKTKDSIKKQMDYYNEQLDMIKTELLKSDNSENAQLVIDQLKQLTEAVKDKIPQLPTDEQ